MFPIQQLCTMMYFSYEYLQVCAHEDGILHESLVRRARIDGSMFFTRRRYFNSSESMHTMRPHWDAWLSHYEATSSENDVLEVK